MTQHLNSRDRSLTRTMVYGVLRYRHYLDFIIEQFSKHPLKKMKPRTLVTLETGAFQLLFLDRIPSSAAVHATVETLKQAGQPRWLIGFANGLLRNISRKKGALPGPEQAKKKGAPILNHPQWLVQRWQNRYGREPAQTICRLNNYEPMLTLRVNDRVNSPAELLSALRERAIEARPCQHSPLGIQLPDYSGPVTELPGFAQGAFQVQDESAQLATLLMGAFDPAAKILDGCAGLGGKTSHLTQLLQDEGRLVATEPDRRRCRLLSENLYRLQLDHRVTIIRTSLESYAQSNPEPFDAILLDAPCSGTGVIRRQPDIRWNRLPEDLPLFHQQQVQLLAASASLLKPGGTLVYATCSLEPEENEQTIERFLRDFPGFSIDHAYPFLPDSAHCLVDANGFFHPLPAADHDGFFAARLVRDDTL